MHSIVITGDSWRDKPAAMALLEKRLRETGYIIYKPNMPQTDACKAFIQDIQRALTAKGDKAVLLLAAGYMDAEVIFGKAALTQATPIPRPVLRDAFDAVFCASEDDSAYTRAWVGAQHMRMISPALSAEEQAEELIRQTLFFLGEPEALEIERKYLIRCPDLNAWPQSVPCTGVEIEQVYLTGDGNASSRVRRRDNLLIHTEKRQISSMRREEVETRISEEEYRQYLRLADPTRRAISKTRYCFVWKGQYFELDVFPFWFDRALLEIELTQESEEICLPDFLTVVREVTNEPEYKNTSLARRDLDPALMPISPSAQTKEMSI